MHDDFCGSETPCKLKIFLEIYIRRSEVVTTHTQSSIDIIQIFLYKLIPASTIAMASPSEQIVLVTGAFKFSILKTVP